MGVCIGTRGLVFEWCGYDLMRCVGTAAVVPTAVTTVHFDVHVRAHVIIASTKLSKFQKRWSRLVTFGMIRLAIDIQGKPFHLSKHQRICICFLTASYRNFYFFWGRDRIPSDALFRGYPGIKLETGRSCTALVEFQHDRVVEVGSADLLKHQRHPVGSCHVDVVPALFAVPQIRKFCIAARLDGERVAFVAAIDDVVAVTLAITVVPSCNLCVSGICKTWVYV